MAQKDDFRPSREPDDSGLSVTVPDIFAPSLVGELSSESTWIPLSERGRISFPGVWSKLEQPGDNGTAVAYGPGIGNDVQLRLDFISPDERSAGNVALICKLGSRALRDYELASLQPLVLESKSEMGSANLIAGSCELLQGKLVLFLQGVNGSRKNAAIILPEGDEYLHLSLSCIEDEFPFFFSHLRIALKSIEWA